MEVGAEGPIWADAVRDIEQKVDKRAEAEWATPASIQASTVTYEPPETIKVTAGDAEFDMAKLTKEILAATGPQNGAGQATGGTRTGRTRSPIGRRSSPRGLLVS